MPFKLPDWAVSFDTEADLTSRNHSYLEGGYWWIEVGAPWHPIKDNNEITHEALRQLLACGTTSRTKAITARRIMGSSLQGFGRTNADHRILGDYVLTQQHVQNMQPTAARQRGVRGMGYRHSHAGRHSRAKQATYPPPRKKDDQWESRGIIVYGIPLRSLYSRNIENMMMAGRPISGSYVAFSSSRVLSTGSIVGQATGVAAALCKKYNATPRAIASEHAQECQQIILRQGGHIPGVKNEDLDDLARRARVTASSEAALVFPVGEGELEMAMPLAQIFPVSTKRVRLRRALHRIKDQ